MFPVKNMLILCLLINKVYARGTYQLYPGPASAGSSSLMATDAFCAVNNCSGMPFVKNKSLGISFTGISGTDIHHLTAGSVFPFKTTAFGIRLLSYGNGILNSSTLGLCFAHRPHSKLSIGIEMNYHTFAIRGYGSTFHIEPGFACYSQISEKLACSFHVFNPLRKVPDVNHEKAISVARLGWLYKINPKVSVHSEIRKTNQTRAVFLSKVQYELNRQFCLYAGFSGPGAQFTFAFGFNRGRYGFSFASVFGRPIGISNNISIAYEFDK